jgi:GH18 family chitinase
MKTFYAFTIPFSIILNITAQQTKVVGYLPGYRFDSSPFIEYCKLTHLNLCFANPDEKGNFRMNSFSAIINQAKMQNPYIVVCISLGGGVLPNGAKENWLKFIDTPENRPILISRILDFVESNQLDGVDFDLEWDAVTAGYSDFVIQLKDSLSKNNKLLTAALPGIYRYPQITNKALAVFDFINIMAYDETGPWAPGKP